LSSSEIGELYLPVLPFLSRGLKKIPFAMATNAWPKESLKRQGSDSQDQYMTAATNPENITEKKSNLEAGDSNEQLYVRPLPKDLKGGDASDDNEEEPVILERAFSRRSAATQTQSNHNHHHSFPQTDLDQGIVGWDRQDDPQNPLNFPRGRKWALLSLVSAITFVSPLASSMFAPAVGFMAEDFGVREELLLSFAVSVYLLGYVVSLPPWSKTRSENLILIVIVRPFVPGSIK
jgi:hypothetical protein